MPISNFKTTIVALSIMGAHAAAPTMSAAQKVAENGHVATVVAKGASNAEKAFQVSVRDFYSGADLTSKINQIDPTIISNDGVDMTKVNKYIKEYHKKAKHNLPTGILADLEKSPSWMNYNQVYTGLPQSKINKLKRALVSRLGIDKKSDRLNFDSNQRELITKAIKENNIFSIMKRLKTKKVSVNRGNEALVIDNKGQFSKASANNLSFPPIKQEKIKFTNYQLEQFYINRDTTSLQKLFPDGCSVNAEGRKLIGAEGNTVLPLSKEQKALVAQILQSRGPVMK